MIKRKQILKTDSKVEQYMVETQQYIELLKRNLVKKILVRQQDKTEEHIMELTNHSLN